MWEEAKAEKKQQRRGSIAKLSSFFFDDTEQSFVLAVESMAVGSGGNGTAAEHADDEHADDEYDSDASTSTHKKKTRKKKAHRHKKVDAAAATLTHAGAHEVIESVADLPDVIARFEQKLSQGQRLRG